MTAASAAAGSDRDRSKAARIREPLCQQRRSEPAAGVRATGRWSEHVAIRLRRHGQTARARRWTKSRMRSSEPRRRTAGLTSNSASPASAAGAIAVCRHHRLRRSQRRAPDQTPPISAAGPLHRSARRNGHRRRPDESARWHQRRARELPGHQSRSTRTRAGTS